MPTPEQAATPDGLVNQLILQVTTPERFAGLSKKNKRQLQGFVTLKYLLGQGKLGSDPAIDEAVKICRQTSLGTGWFFRAKLVGPIALTVGMRKKAGEREDFASPASMAVTCDQVIRKIVPELK